MHTGRTEASESAQILHAVEVMIERYGRHACHEAAIRVQELASCGDSEGAKLWRQVEAHLQLRVGEAMLLHHRQH